MCRVVIVYLNAGGGHRASAASLTEAIRQQRRPWLVELLNLDEALASIDPSFRTIRVRGGEVYNWAFRHGYTLGSAQVIAMMHGYIRLSHRQQVDLLRLQWRRLLPDLVVSVVPHYNRALFESLRAELPGVPMVTILTDLAD